MTSTLNPLLLEHIVENVFKKLALRDLNVCRLVCKMWYEEIKRIKSRWEKIQILSKEDVSELIRKIEAGGALKISTFEARHLNLEEPWFGQFLMTIEPTLSSLVLADSKITLSTFHRLIRSLNNLQSLDLGTLKTKYGEYLSVFPIYDESLPPRKVVLDNIESVAFMSYNINPTRLSSTIKTFPKLKKLCVYNLYIESLENLAEIRIATLEELEITCFEGTDFNNKHLEMLRKIKIHSLKSLKITNLSPDLNITSLREFVEIQKNTLECLELHHNKCGPSMATTPTVNPFPLELPNLTFLAIDKPFVRNLSQICSYLPKLEHIAFNFHRNSNYMGILPSKMKIQKTVTAFSIHWIDPKSLCMLSNIFPYITRMLMLNCTDDILRTIYSCMPNLEILNCTDLTDAVTQEGFTGIRTDRLTRLPTNVEIEQLDKLRDFAAITGLKKLKHLTLRFYENNENSISMSTILFYGIIHVKSLMKISLEGIELSDDLIRTIKQDFERHVVKYKLTDVKNGPCHHIISGNVQHALADYKTYGRIAL